jgi:hypothetical protein
MLLVATLSEHEQTTLDGYTVRVLAHRRALGDILGCLATLMPNRTATLKELRRALPQLAVESYELSRLMQDLKEYNASGNVYTLPLELNVIRAHQGVFVAKFSEWAAATAKGETIKVLSVNDLSAVERPTSEGGHLTEGAEVSIIDHQPLEVYPNIAHRIVRNMEKGVLYRYYFPADSERAVAQLIYRLSTALTTNPSKQEEQVQGTLSIIKQRLIIILSKNPWPFRFSIHNAQDARAAVCYMRPPGSDQLVEWCRGELAFGISEAARHQFIRTRSVRQCWIRAGNIELNSAHKGRIRDALTEEFSVGSASEGLILRVLDLCFGSSRRPKR